VVPSGEWWKGVPLRVGVLCLCFMGLSLSNRHIAGGLGLAASDVQIVTEPLRRGLAAKTPEVERQGEVEPDARASSGIDKAYVVAGHKGQPAAVAKRGGSDGAASWQARRTAGRLAKDKPPLLGMIQRGGQVVLPMPARVQQRTIQPIIGAALAPRAPSSTPTNTASTRACQPGATGTRLFATPAARRPATASARSTPTPSKGSGPCCAPCFARTGASRKTSCRFVSASSGSCTTRRRGRTLLGALITALVG